MASHLRACDWSSLGFFLLQCWSVPFVFHFSSGIQVLLVPHTPTPSQKKYQFTSINCLSSWTTLHCFWISLYQGPVDSKIGYRDLHLSVHQTTQFISATTRKITNRSTALLWWIHFLRCDSGTCIGTQSKTQTHSSHYNCKKTQKGSRSARVVFLSISATFLWHASPDLFLAAL